jgi:hypothetical protein
VLSELAHDPAALGAGQLVDVELAVQVVGLVLQAAGQLAGSCDGDLPLLKAARAGRPARGDCARIR